MPTACVPARIGLLGNPSDGYGGRVIATTVDELEATVVATPADRWTFESPVATWHGESLADAERALDQNELSDGTELFAAAAMQLEREGLGVAPHHLRFTSTIPRQAGLSGSSAVIAGALRVLTAAPLERVDLARLALAAEVDVLGWTAGPQDRVVQAFGGLLDMRFDEAWDPDRYERLDPSRLPPLVVSWDTRPGSPSTTVHQSVSQRWHAGDTEVIEVIARFVELAEEGRRALDDDLAADVWPSLANEAFDLRMRCWSVTDRDHAMVEAVRALGGGATLAGSGGAVVGHFPDEGLVPDAVAALEALGAHTLVPSFAAGR